MPLLNSPPLRYWAWTTASTVNGAVVMRENMTPRTRSCTCSVVRASTNIRQCPEPARKAWQPFLSPTGRVHVCCAELAGRTPMILTLTVNGAPETLFAMQMSWSLPPRKRIGVKMPPACATPRDRSVNAEPAIILRMKLRTVMRRLRVAVLDGRCVRTDRPERRRRGDSRPPRVPFAITLARQSVCQWDCG